jgi:hypothetical protein
MVPVRNASREGDEPGVLGSAEGELIAVLGQKIGGMPPASDRLAWRAATMALTIRAAARRPAWRFNGVVW